MSMSFSSNCVSPLHVCILSHWLRLFRYNYALLLTILIQWKLALWFFAFCISKLFIA